MANRVIKDSILSSPSLAKLKAYYQDQFPRWLLAADDWGCFNADPEILKGFLYPKRRESIKDIIKTTQVFNDNGILFIWEEEERMWGYFAKWDKHQFCNASGVDSMGKYTKHRRKTPEPPQDQLNQYLTKHFDKFRQSETKSLIPNPNPIPKPIPIIPSQIKDLLGQFSSTTQEKIRVYIERVRQKNKSKTITEGRKITLLTELYNTYGRCNDEKLFNYALEQAIGYDACSIGYINAVIKNKKIGKPK